MPLQLFSCWLHAIYLIWQYCHKTNDVLTLLQHKVAQLPPQVNFMHNNWYTCFWTGSSIQVIDMNDRQHDGFLTLKIVLFGNMVNSFPV